MGTRPSLTALLAACSRRGAPRAVLGPCVAGGSGTYLRPSTGPPPRPAAHLSGAVPVTRPPGQPRAGPWDQAQVERAPMLRAGKGSWALRPVRVTCAGSGLSRGTPDRALCPLEGVRLLSCPPRHHAWQGEEGRRPASAELRRGSGRGSRCGARQCTWTGRGDPGPGCSSHPRPSGPLAACPQPPHTHALHVCPPIRPSVLSAADLCPRCGLAGQGRSVAGRPASAPRPGRDLWPCAENPPQVPGSRSALGLWQP